MTLQNIQRLTYFRYNEKGEQEEVDTASGEVIHVKSDLILEDVELKRYPYSTAVARIISQEIRKGETLISLSKKPGFPSRTILYKWRDEHEEFRNMLDSATLDRADNHIEEIIDLAKKAPTLDPKEVAGMKLAVETRKWLAEKDNPEKYGSKTKVIGGDSAPLVINVVTGIDREAKIDDSVPVEFKEVLEKEYAEIQQEESGRVSDGSNNGKTAD